VGSGKRGASEERNGIPVCHPAPRESALPHGEIEAFIAAALRAGRDGWSTWKRTSRPFLLQEVARLSGGKTLKANIALLVANATLAGQLPFRTVAAVREAGARRRSSFYSTFLMAVPHPRKGRPSSGTSCYGF